MNKKAIEFLIKVLALCKKNNLTVEEAAANTLQDFLFYKICDNKIIFMDGSEAILNTEKNTISTNLFPLP